jgi:hypothetical protein
MLSFKKKKKNLYFEILCSRNLQVLFSHKPKASLSFSIRPPHHQGRCLLSIFMKPGMDKAEKESKLVSNK